jgi:hypothetical protein
METVAPLGRTLMMGLGVGVLGIGVSSLMKRFSDGGVTPKQMNEMMGCLHALRRGESPPLPPPRFPSLRDFPAAYLSLEMNGPLVDMCVRMRVYETFDATAFDALVAGASGCALLQLELGMGWAPWTLATPSKLHACTYQMLSATRKLRQSLARANASYLGDFDEVATEIAAWHNDSNSNALLEAKARFEAECECKKPLKIT